MDNYYNLNISGNLVNIENDMNEWLNMPYDIRKTSNDIAIAKYGMSNEELYNLMKGTAVKNPDKTEVEIESAINESLFISNSLFEYNMADFYNGDINICFITGFSGSGKSTLGIALKEKIPNSEFISLDGIGAYGLFTKEETEGFPKVVRDFFDKDPVGKEYKTSTDRMRGLLFCAPAFINYLIKHKGSKTKYIVEGIAIYTGVQERKIDINSLKPFAMIIMGTSVIKSTYRAVVRDVKNDLDTGTKVDFEFIKRVFTRIKNRFSMNFQADKILNNLKRDIQTEGAISYKNDLGERISTDSDNLHNTIKDYEKAARIEKIRIANLIMTEDDDIVIINDWIDDNDPDYTGDYLQDKFELYKSLNAEHKLKSDQHTLRLWNRSVINMYEYMKGKLKTHKNSTNVDPEGNFIVKYSDKDRNLKNYERTVDRVNESDNILEKYYRKLDCLCHSDMVTLYEATVLESFADRININGKTYFQGAPEVTPFLTYDEYVNNPKCLDMRKLSRVDPFTYVTNYMDTTKSAYKELRDASVNKDENKLLEMGWNPVVPVNPVTIKYARERQIKWLNDHYNITHVNISGFKPNIEDYIRPLYLTELAENDLAPVYLVFKKTSVKPLGENFKSIFQYSNPGISFESTMNNIFVRGSNNYGKAIDVVNLKEYYSDYRYGDEYSDCAIVCFFVSIDTAEKMLSRMNYCYDNARNTIANRLSYFFKDLSTKKGYSIENITSDMIDILLELVGLEKHTRGYWKVNYKYFTIFEGQSRYYSYKDTDAKIYSLLRKKSYRELKYLKESEVSRHLSHRLLESFDFKTDNPKINQLVKEVNDLLTPVAVDVEFRRESYESLLANYEEAVEALSKCNENDIEMMKRKFIELLYITSISDSIMKTLKNDDPMYRKWESLSFSAGIIADRYNKIIKQIEPDDKTKEVQYMDSDEGLVPRKVEVDNKIYKYSSGHYKL